MIASVEERWSESNKMGEVYNSRLKFQSIRDALQNIGRTSAQVKRRGGPSRTKEIWKGKKIYG